MNPYDPKIEIDLGFRKVEVVFTWRVISALQAELGANYLGVVQDWFHSRDIDGLVRLLTMTTDVTEDELLDKAVASEGFVGAYVQLEHAWAICVVGPKRAKETAPDPLKARLATWFRSLIPQPSGRA